MSLLSILNYTPKELAISALRVTAVALGGRAIVWLSAKIQEKTGTNLGFILNKIIPNPAQQQIFNLSQLCVTPIKWIHQRTSETIKERTFSIYVAPVVEEMIFRVGLQQGLGFLLTKMGMSAMVASPLSILGASIAFGMAHYDDLQSIHFTNTMLMGSIYGAVYHQGNGLEAAAAHALYNKILWTFSS